MSKNKKFKLLEEIIPSGMLNWKNERDKSSEERFEKKIEIKPITQNHKKYLQLLEEKQIILVDGPAGTGKTNYAAGYALKLLKEGKINKIIISRPIVTCGKGLGFLPGGVDEKIHPFMIPVLEAFEYYISKQEIDEYIAKDIIRITPIELMRGLTINKTFVILDEAQNCEYEQLQMFCMRFGEDAKFVINGDIYQNDLKHDSDLAEIIKRLSGMKEVGIIQFNENDILRNPMLKEIGQRLDKHRNLDYNSDIQQILHNGSESWYKHKCKFCKKACWINNGDESDLEIEDYDSFECWSCKKENILYKKEDGYKVISYELPRI